jgi:hypothetical protein
MGCLSIKVRLPVSFVRSCSSKLHSLPPRSVQPIAVQLPLHAADITADTPLVELLHGVFVRKVQK